MGRIVLLDFDEEDRQRLAGEEFDAELRSTISESGDLKAADLPADCETVFYQMGRQAQEGQSHVPFSEPVSNLVEQGGNAVCFIGDGSLFQLISVIGMFPELHFQDANPGESLTFRSRPPFSLIFDKFQPLITHAYKLIQESVPEASWDMGSTVNGNYEFLAKTPDGFPVSLLIHKGKGFYLLLPWFGSDNIEVVNFFLKNIRPSLKPRTAEDKGSHWLDGEDYTFPILTQLFAQRDGERKRHEQALREIEDRIREARATEQESFHRLLKSEGQELKKAVVQAFQYLGWGKIVDVDEYWKKVIRSKEEDIWLIEEADKPIEACLQREPLILVLVKGQKNWAPDDDCALLQKYKGRRMQEFGNTKMKAVLVGNYFSTQEAKSRDNPFAPVQVEEAQKDGNGLITTYDLFKAVKAEKEGRVEKETIRRQLIEKIGLITFEY